MEKIKRCPFCGWDAIVYKTDNIKLLYGVECRMCGAGTILSADLESAIKLWNQRCNEVG